MLGLAAYAVVPAVAEVAEEGPAVIAAVIIAASVLAPSGVTASIQADPVCLPVTAQPGASYVLPVAASAGTLAVVPDTMQPAATLHQVPPSWVSFGPSAVRLAVPSGAAPGAYWSHIQVTAGSGSGGVTLGAGAATSIVFTVGPSAVPPPPCGALALAQASGKYPPWPTRAFATTGWKQVFARDKGGPVTPDGGPTAAATANAAAAPQPVTTPRAVTAAYKVPSKIPSDWAGWLVIILILGLALRWLLKLLGLGK